MTSNLDFSRVFRNTVLIARILPLVIFSPWYYVHEFVHEDAPGKRNIADVIAVSKPFT